MKNEESLWERPMEQCVCLWKPGLLQPGPTGVRSSTALWEMLRRVVLVLNPLAGWPCSSHSDSLNFGFLIYNIKELAWLASNLFVGVSNFFHHPFIPDYCSFASLMYQRSQAAYIGIQLPHRSSSFKLVWDSISLQLHPQIKSHGH